MTTLVTGASGFIGRHVVRELAREIDGIVASGRGPAPAWLDDGVRWAGADLLAAGEAERLVDSVRPHRVLHLAWNAVPGAFWTATDNLRWLAATAVLTERLAAAGGGRLVLAGTCAEYDWSSDGLYVEHATPTQPATLYGTCKLAAGDAAEALARQADGLSVARGRIFFLYGAGEHERRLVPSVARGLLAQQPVEVSFGHQVRDLLDVRDVASALVALLNSPVTGPVNIASGEPRPLRDVIGGVAERVGRPDLVRWGARPAPASEPDRLVAAVDRLRDEVGWRPSISLERGLADAVAQWSA